MSRSSRRGPWLPEEDATLLRLVKTQGPNNWVRISQHMQHRSPKQCRERYHQNLKPSLNHEPISAQEGELIEELVGEMGKRWAEIARRLGNRSDNAVKNWWNGSMNRRKRHSVHPGGGSTSVGYRTHPIPASGSLGQIYLQHRGMTSTDEYRDRQSLEPPTSCEEPLNGYELERNYGSLRQDRQFHSSQLPIGHLQHPSSSRSAELPPESLLLPQSSSQLRQEGAFAPSLPRLPSYPTPTSVHRNDWHLPPLTHLERPILSPAPTVASHASSNQQAPSLVSDNQSNCSISPKTVPSPRPGIPSSNTLQVQLWSDTQRPFSRGSLQDIRPCLAEYKQDQGHVSAFQPHLNRFSGSPSAQLLPAPEPPLSGHRGGSSDLKDFTVGSRTLATKDARMDVSRLLD
ncbi:hypothetical protein PV08_04239 [Exophiala spinifera]|uniref:MYB family conidiophore development protein FlbD n=1 Tax=Exophiala spinifera TaxID=91928 RepID=A0A0D2BDN8_9EURO|nr:uncharacterized protein PV08_04239 [Exophiala spinifera]KIW17048.1 hypothetical protein PV08_04239 [Exophiala spinifera]